MTPVTRWFYSDSPIVPILWEHISNFGLWLIYNREDREKRAGSIQSVDTGFQSADKLAPHRAAMRIARSERVRARAGNERRARSGIGPRRRAVPP